MAPTFDAITAISSGGSHTGGAGAGLGILGFISESDVTSPTWGGASMTLLASKQHGSGNYYHGLYYILGGVAGAKTISWTGGGTGIATTFAGGAFAPRAAVVSEFSSSYNLDAMNLTPTSTPSDLAFDLMTQRSVGDGSNCDPNASQTIRIETNAATGGGSRGYGFTTKAGATPTVAMGWTRAAGNGDIGCYAASIPSPAGSQVIAVWFQHQQKFLQDLKRGLIPPGLLRRRYREVFAI